MYCNVMSCNEWIGLDWIGCMHVNHVNIFWHITQNLPRILSDSTMVFKAMIAGRRWNDVALLLFGNVATACRVTEGRPVEMEDSMGKSRENLENDGPLTQKVKVFPSNGGEKGVAEKTQKKREKYGKIINKSING